MEKKLSNSLYDAIWTELYLPPSPFNVTLLGDGAFKEIIKVKWGHKTRALIW